MDSFVPQMRILPPSRQTIWTSLAFASKSGFVLYGGTAIALRLGHRQSIDFDFFSDQPLDRSRLYKSLPILADSTVIQDTPDSFSVLVPVNVSAILQYVKLSFFGNIAIGRIGKPEVTADGVMVVAPLADMMAHKLKVIMQRIIETLPSCSNMECCLTKPWPARARSLKNVSAERKPQGPGLFRGERPGHPIRRGTGNSRIRCEKS
ncbi:MAG: nucleotidyl transferase AbiEii/AbiGii toxin family protein [Syntrophobacterales bacterium]|nr:nucleotidyl transferase AbiEii/AbiGii toxin family protein [Syntrophobacterales bacterium]